MWEIAIYEEGWSRAVFGGQLYSMRLMFMDYSEGEAREYFAEQVREFIPKGAVFATLTRNNYWQRDSETMLSWHEGDDVPEVDWDLYCIHGHRLEHGCWECEEEEEEYLAETRS